MLRRLTIADFVIVERLELEFGAGFTVLTGETGAGKSILIDALTLALGERADPIAVRQGAARADITAEFDTDGNRALVAWLVDSDLAGDDGVCLLRRVVEASGRSRGFINGHSATAAQLREAGDFLVDIHGQHQHQSLSRPATQRALTDAYGGLEAQAELVAEAWRTWQRRREERLAFEGNAAAINAERERLEWQSQELDALKLNPGEWDAVGAEHARLAHAASLIEAAQSGVEILSEGEGAALDQLNAVLARLQPLLQHDARLKEILDALVPAQIQLQEGANALRHYSERTDLDPQRLREVEQRLDALHTAARKYRVEPDALPELATHTRERLAELGAGGDPETLRRREAEAEATYRVLRTQLAAHASFLTRFSATETMPGAVTVILSGNRPTATVAAEASRWCAIDGRLDDLTAVPPPSVHLMPLVSQSWTPTFSWFEDGVLPETDRAALRRWVAVAHQQGRRLRFWGVPDQPFAWKELYAAGVDLINTDNLKGLNAFLQQASTEKP